uniref:Uncharacterized protein n=1 Tax=Phytophthora ramorum TaxID=164328 RepID=H3H1U1_PHYRM
MSSQGQPPTTPSASSASSDVPTASATASGTSPTPTSSAPPPATAPPTDNHAAVGPQHVTSGPEYFLRHGNLRGASIYASSAAATSTPPPGSSPAPSTSAILSQPERDTLRAAADTLDRYIAAGTYADLAEDHAVLQARVSELTLELDRVYSSAAPFVCVVEEEISRLRHDRGTLQLALADCQGELAQRLDNRWELDTARTLLDTERRAHADIMSYLYDQIAVLERQVADLETRREIVEVGACRDRVIADLRLARDQHSAADGRRQQLEADVTGLEAAVRRLENDLMDLQRDTDRQLTEMRQRVARSDAEREEFRLRASDASTQFLAAQTQLRQLTAERDRTAISLQHARAQVATSRTTIARLEGQVLQSQGDRNRIQALERQNTALARENMSLTESLNAARTDQAAAIDTRNQAMRECNAIRQRVAALASFSRPSGNPQDHGGPDDDGPEDDDEGSDARNTSRHGSTSSRPRPRRSRSRHSRRSPRSRSRDHDLLCLRSRHISGDDSVEEAGCALAVPLLGSAVQVMMTKLHSRPCHGLALRIDDVVNHWTPRVKVPRVDRSASDPPRPATPLISYLTIPPGSHLTDRQAVPQMTQEVLPVAALRQTLPATTAVFLVVHVCTATFFWDVLPTIGSPLLRYPGMSGSQGITLMRIAQQLMSPRGTCDTFAVSASWRWTWISFTTISVAPGTG